MTDSRFRDTLETHKRTASMSVKDVHCIYPGDLFLFLRKPLFLIVESDNSSAFQHIPRYFNQPLVVLMVRIICSKLYFDILTFDIKISPAKIVLHPFKSNKVVVRCSHCSCIVH